MGTLLGQKTPAGKANRLHTLPYAQYDIQLRVAPSESPLAATAGIALRSDLYSFLVSDISEQCFFCPITQVGTIVHSTALLNLGLTYTLWNNQRWAVALSGIAGYQFNLSRERTLWSFHGRHPETAAYLNGLERIFDRGKNLVVGVGLEVNYRRFALVGYYLKDLEASYTPSFRTDQHEYVNRSDWWRISLELGYRIPLCKFGPEPGREAARRRSTN